MCKRNVIFPLLLTLVLIMVNACEDKDRIEVIPGKSVAGIEIGMTEQQVIGMLGQPEERFSSADASFQNGTLYTIGKNGEIGSDDAPNDLLESIMFVFSEPPLDVVFEDSEVVKIQLGVCDNVSVYSYPFLEFKWLSSGEFDSLGKPSYMFRNSMVELQIRMKNPDSPVGFEYYHCGYKEIDLELGLVFDRAREKEGKRFIAVNYIQVGL